MQTRWNLLLLATAGLTACAGPADDVADEPIGVVEAALTASKTFQRGTHGTVADTTISAIHMRKNFGDEKKLVVSKRHEALLRFDLASIPPEAVITSATLTLYQHGHDGDDDRCDDDDDRRDDDRRGFSAVPIQIHLATASWSEDRVTYGKFDQAFLPTAAGILLPSGNNTYKSVDLKAAVQAWVNGSRANHGIVLRTTSRKRWAFAASENSRVTLRPALKVTYSTPDDHCSPNPCLQGGTCTNSWSGYTCQCPPGYTGAHCETNIDDCSGTPCQNGGVCSDGVGSYTCSCAPGFGGAHCETNVDDCAGSPCDNGGVCTDGVDGFTCACAIGYSGPTCDTLIDECASSPCQNDGVCTNGVGSYTCACAPGYTGTNCEVNIDDCAGAPCHNGGSCEDGVGSFVCNCAGGFTGPTCETNIDDCASAPCMNGGVCVDGTAGYACQCNDGFEGTNCETNIDDCAAHPCQNGGACVDGDATYVCACAPGYGGASCETDIDDCDPNPCQNGGACNDGIDSYSCDCAEGYEGPSCETLCTGPQAASAVATVGDATAPSGFEYRTPAATASSPTECPEWSCGTGIGPAAAAIDDDAATGWNSGSWDFGPGYTLTLTFAAPTSFHGLHVISSTWPTDDLTFTVTLTNDVGAETTLDPRTAAIFDNRPAGARTGVDVGFSPAGYHGVVTVELHVAAPYVSPDVSTWIDVRELQLIAPAGCEPPPACPAGTTTFGDACYQRFTQLPPHGDQPFNYWLWADADCGARFAGGHLVRIGSAEENTFVMGLASGGSSMLGGTDAERAVGDYAWLDGSPLAYSNWYPGEPNSRGVNRFGFFLTEDWIVMGSDGGWNDLPYTDGGPYTCEFPR